MSDTVDQQLDKILRYFRGWVSLAGNSGEPMYKLGEYEQGELDEAKQAILTLINQEVEKNVTLAQLTALAQEKNRLRANYRKSISEIDSHVANLERHLKDKS